MSWREKKRAALAPVHETFSIPAVYLTHAEGTPVPVNVRLHQRPVVASQQGGEDWAGGAQMLDLVDRIVFDATEVPEVVTNAYVLFSDSEAFRTGASRPQRDGFISVEVSDVTGPQLATLLGKVDTSGDEWKAITPWSQQ